MITGGAGGTGGDGGNSAQPGIVIGGFAGNGGDGGAGIVIAVSGALLTNAGTITGGDGGNTSTGSTGLIFGNVGRGGDGVVGSNLTINNSGTIAGNGGGRGGDGVVGSNLTINNSGAITGNNAINFTGGANSLNLQTGWVLTGVIAVNGSLAFTQSTDVTLVNRIEASSTSIIQNGVGRLTLTGLAFASSVSIASGSTLALSGNGELRNGTLNLVSGATFDISASTNVNATRSIISGNGGSVLLGSNTYEILGGSNSFGGDISGSGGLLLRFSSTSQTLTGSNGYTGLTTVDGSSTLLLSGAGSISNSSAVYLLNSGRFDISGANGPNVTIKSLTTETWPFFGAVVTLGSNTLILSAASGTFLGAINGSGGLTLAAGTESLTYINGYTGRTTINGGTLALGERGDIAASSGVTLAPGASFDISALTAAGTSIRSLAGAGGTVTLDTKTLTLSNASGTFGGAINGGGGLTLAAGTQILTGSNGYTGATIINGGTLALTGGGSITASAGVTLSPGGSFDISASTNTDVSIRALDGTGGTVSLGSNSLTLSNTLLNVFDGTISGSGGLTHMTGTQGLGGSNSYTGTTTVNGGFLALVNGGSIAASSGVIIASSGGFDISFLTGTGASITSLTGAGTVGLGSKTLTLSNASGSFGGTIDGTGGLALTAGTETLTGTNGYTGATAINGGRLALSGGGSIASSSGVTMTAGVFDISASAGAGAAIRSLAGSGGSVTLGTRTLTLSNASGTFAGTIAGSGGLALTAGTQTLTGNSSSFSGIVNVNSGRLLIGTGGTLGNGAAVFNVHNGGTLGGGGTVGGNVAIDAGGILSAGFSPGTLTITGNLVQSIGSITNFELGQSGVVGGASNDLVNVGGDLTRGGTLNLIATTAGWYRLYNVAGTISGSYDTINSGALSHTIYTTIPNQVNVLLAGAGQSVQFWDGGDTTGNGAANGGTATWNAGGTNWTSLPGAQINDQWRAGVGIFAGTAGTVTVAGSRDIQGLQFTVDGYSLIGGTLNMTGDPFSDATKSFFTTDAGVTATIASTIAGAGIGLTKQGAGTLVLTGTNTYDGGTTINSGALQIGNGGTTGSIIGDVTSNAVFAINRSDAVTFAHIVSGTGALHQSGTGSLILTGANAYTGGTTINAGTLQIGNGGTTGSIVGNVTNNGVVAINRSNALTIAGVISGTGALRQNGPGTLTLTGTNIYTGVTTINFGTIQIGNGGTTGSIVGDVINNGILAIDRSDALTLPGDISGTGALQQNGAGVTTLAGAATHVGATAVNAGTLRASAANRFSAASAVTVAAGAVLNANGFDQTIASLAGAGNVALGAGRFTLANAASAIFSGAIAGTGGLTLAAGTQTLSGVSAYTGATIITGGSLIVNGSIVASSGVTVGAGATIGGSGILPALTVNGTLAPGNSPGTLTVNGNLVLGAGSLYLAEVEGPLADRVTVTGTASLAGTLRLVPLGGAYMFAAPYTLLSAAGGLGGTTFGTVDTTGSFGDGVTTRIAYTGTEVRLTLTPKPLAPIVDPMAPGVTPPPGPGATPPSGPGVGRLGNALSVAGAIDAAIAAGADPSLLFAIYNLPAGAIPAALNQLSGEAHTAAPAMAHVASDQFLRTMLDGSGAGRLSGALSGPGGAAGFTADLPSKQDGPGRPSFDPARFSLWGATFGSTGRNDGDRAVGSANRNLSDGHVAVGADIRLGANTVAGVAVAGGQSRASLSGGLGKAQADVFQAGLYGRTTLGTVNLAAALAYARLETDTTRAIPALSRSGVTASYATQAWSGRIGASLPVATWHGLTLSPFAAFQAVRASSPAAVERDGMGATAGMLTLARRSDMTSRSELGLQLDTSLIAGATPVTGFVRAAWTHYYQRDAELTASLNGLPGASFTATGARPDRNAALLAAGADIRLSQSVSLGARIDADLSGNTRRVGGTAKLSVSF
ncbi:MAG: autotransporter-associated beta strand repeat-containing protein [Kaiparowitsia implicata GSE-PSE-MK54-09C]|nr:autotransporter-associated beta strand repeat-containing protein [Kaiparowitsia implicata GSE-PSE-MK54-09C]